VIQNSYIDSTFVVSQRLQAVLREFTLLRAIVQGMNLSVTAENL